MKRTDNPNRGRRHAARLVAPRVVHRASPCICTLADGTTYTLEVQRKSSTPRDTVLTVAAAHTPDVVKYAAIVGNIGNEEG